MARYAKVDRRIWNDQRFSTCSEREKLAFLFLLTHPNLTMLGAMRASEAGLAAELGMPAKAFGEAFREVLSKGLAKHDPKASFVWLPNFLKYNKPESPNVVKSWPEAFDLIPECDQKHQLFEQLKTFVKGMSEGFQEAFTQAFPKDYGESGTVTGTVTEIKTIVESSASDHTARPRKVKAVDPLEQLVEEGFEYFLSRTGHYPDQYDLDAKRRKMGLEGFQELRKFVRGRDPVNDPLPMVRDLFRVAVDRLVASPFHAGQNKDSKRYWEWHHLFRSKEYASPKKLVGWWLNDQNFPGRTERWSA